MLEWDVEPGAMVLLEPDDGSCIPCVLLVEHEGRLLVGIGASEPPGERDELSVSVFTDANYWKLLAASRPREDLVDEHPGEGPLIELIPRTPPAAIERRAHPRLRTALPVGLETADPLDTLRAETIDLSAGGMRVLADTALSGRGPNITLTLPGGDELRCHGRVVGEESAGGRFEYRLEFLDLDDDAFAALADFTRSPGATR